MKKNKAGQHNETRAMGRPKESTLRVMRTWENFESSVGGREELVLALQHSTDENGQRLLAHLEDPRARRLSLRKVSADARVSFPQLYKIYSDALRAKAHTEAMLIQAQHLPAIMKSTCQDALSQTNTCPTCGGEGKARGSIDNRKLIFESAGLTGKRGAPLVAIQQNLSSEEVGWGPGSFEALVHRGRDAIEGITRDRKSIPEATGEAQSGVEEGKDAEDV